MFERNIKGSVEILKNKRVAIAGCGGLGSNAAVALARSGVLNFIIADYDKVELSNLNRQCFFREDVGKTKVSALTEKIKNINPDAFVDSFFKKVEKKDIVTFFGDADILIEAFDSVESKAMLVESWIENFPDKPVICGSGIGGIGDFKDIGIVKRKNVYICGDMERSDQDGTLAPKVAIVANMQAFTALKLLLEGLS